MKKTTTGIHHITAIAGDAQRNIDFYTGVLGLRLVKKTVNFDDPGTYHFYFGDEQGHPGTIITFFPWQDLEQGTVGDGQVGVTVYAVPTGALGFWEKRLQNHKVHTEYTTRFGERYLAFSDPDGLKLELVERPASEQKAWTWAGITAETAIMGFDGAVLYSHRPQETMQLLDGGLGLEKVAEDNGFIRYRSLADRGSIVDIRATASAVIGRQGTGTVHHIAWRASSAEDQMQWQSLLYESGYRVTPVQDRNYFTSIYFREKGGILFEIATDGPGFAIDENLAELGTALKLPAQYEKYRSQLEKSLPAIYIKESL